MYKTLSLLLLFFCLNLFAQQAQEEIGLSNEYLSILNGNNYDQSRIDEIESIAELEEGYEYLRGYIADTYLFNHPSRASHAKKDIYERFLEPNLDSKRFNSIPLSVYFVAFHETNYEKELISLLESKIKNNDGWSKINLAGYYYFKGQEEKALNELGDLYRKRVGLFFESENLTVTQIEIESSTPFIQKGDIILGINNNLVSDVSSFSDELNKYEPGSSQSLIYKRNNQTLKSKFTINEVIDYMMSPYAAVMYVNMDEGYKANKLIKDFKNFKVSDEMKNSPLYKKLEGINEYAYCKLNLNPLIKDNKKRLEGVDSCKSSLKKLEEGILLDGTNPMYFELMLHKYNPFWGISYADTIDLMSSTHMKSYIGYGLGLEQEEPNLELAKKYIEKSPFVFSNTEAIKLAVIDIHKNGYKNYKEQYKNISDNTLQILTSLSTSIGHPGYLSRYHLLNMYKYDEKNKDTNKAYRIAKKSYELDKEAYSSTIISLSKIYYYGDGVEKNKKRSHELLEEFAEAYKNKPISITPDVKWAFDLLTRNFYFGKVVKKDLEKSYKFGKIIEGEVEDIDRIISGLVIDGLITIDKAALDDTLSSKSFKKMMDKNNLNSYVAYKAYAGLKPFKKQDLTTACSFASQDPRMLTDYISQSIYSYCVISEELSDNKYDYKRFITNMSKNGASEASWILFNLELDKGYKTSNELKGYLIKSKQQLKNNSSTKLIDNIYWLNDTSIFDVQKKSLEADFLLINSMIKEESDFEQAIARAKKEKEKIRLAELRKANRKVAAEKTGNFLGNLLEFTFKAALVVGTVALVGDALEDASPEAIQAFSDSLSNSYQTYTYDWDGFYDAYGNWVYRCRTIENGRFAEDYHCIGEVKDDDRWPSY